MIVVHVAAVCSDSIIALPIDWRMRESGSPWPVGPAGAPMRRRGFAAGELGLVGALGVHRRLSAPPLPADSR